jgi:hypothetical protein
MQIGSAACLIGLFCSPMVDFGRKSAMKVACRAGNRANRDPACDTSYRGLAKRLDRIGIEQVVLTGTAHSYDVPVYRVKCDAKRFGALPRCS